MNYWPRKKKQKTKKNTDGLFSFHWNWRISIDFCWTDGMQIGQFQMKREEKKITIKKIKRLKIKQLNVVGTTLTTNT
jgi:hypothetical protein